MSSRYKCFFYLEGVPYLNQQHLFTLYYKEKHIKITDRYHHPPSLLDLVETRSSPHHLLMESVTRFVFSF